MAAKSRPVAFVRLSFALAVAWLALLGSAPGGAAGAAAPVQSAAAGEWDLRLDAPIATWDEAIPLGNGLTGGLLWGENGVVRLSLDRGNLWDLRTPGIYKEPDWTYATIQRLVAEGNQRELVRRFDAPFEEIPYPTKLPGARLELTLDDGRRLTAFDLDMKRAVGRASFDGGEVAAFFSARESVAMLRVSGSLARLRLVPPASLPKLGYAAARAGETPSSAWLEQEAALGLSYAVHVESRAAGGATEIAVCIATSRDAAKPLALAQSRTRAALARGYAALLTPHLAWWARFWSASSVRLPDPAAARHYNLVQYFYGAASRRGAPPMPLQGVWTADAGTLPPWKGDYHFDLNVQLSYWAYLQAGRFDEGRSYLDFMWDLVPAHRDFARRFFSTPGIVVPGVMALDGQPLAGWGQYSLSPVQGAWVAQAFYLHWRYTMDPEFLATRAYPYCRLVAEGLQGLLKPGERGTLVLPLSSSPEIHDNSLKAWMTPLTNYDLALMRSLFGWLSDMARAQGLDAEALRWTSLLGRMDPLAIDPGGEGLLVSRTEALTQSHRHHSHLMAIHPLGLLTVEGGEAERATVLASLDRIQSFGTRNWVGYSFSWAACLEARAGRADEALRYLRAYLDAFILRNGFHANGDQTKSGLSNFTYRPFTLEGNFAAAQAVHEMLLQGWGGVLRVFPAVPASWADVSFTDMRAEGGLVVSAARKAGRTSEVSVRAVRAASVTVRDPFAPGTGRWTITRAGAATASATTPVQQDRGLLQFRLAAGDLLMGKVIY